jgi:hypothetical protein
LDFFQESGRALLLRFLRRFNVAKVFLGGCLCGAVRFEALGKPQNPHTCSCEWCQRHSGATSLAWVEFARSDVRWTGEAGEPTLYRSSDYSSRAFCGRCGSTLGAIDDAPAVGLVLGAFDDKSDPALQPTAHSFEDLCPAWAKVQGMAAESTV